MAAKPSDWPDRSKAFRDGAKEYNRTVDLLYIKLGKPKGAAALSNTYLKGTPEWEDFDLGWDMQALKEYNDGLQTFQAPTERQVEK